MNNRFIETPNKTIKEIRKLNAENKVQAEYNKNKALEEAKKKAKKECPIYKEKMKARAIKAAETRRFNEAERKRVKEAKKESERYLHNVMIANGSIKPNNRSQEKESAPFASLVEEARRAINHHV